MPGRRGLTRTSSRLDPCAWARSHRVRRTRITRAPHSNPRAMVLRHWAHLHARVSGQRPPSIRHDEWRPGGPNPGRRLPRVCSDRAVLTKRLSSGGDSPILLHRGSMKSLRLRASSPAQPQAGGDRLHHLQAEVRRIRWTGRLWIAPVLTPKVRTGKESVVPPRRGRGGKENG